MSKDTKKQALSEEQLEQASGGMKIVLEGDEAEEYLRMRNSATSGYSSGGSFSSGGGYSSASSFNSGGYYSGGGY